MDMDRVLEGTVGLLALTEQALISYTFFSFGSEAASCGDRTIAFSMILASVRTKNQTKRHADTRGIPGGVLVCDPLTVHQRMHEGEATRGN
jgi:hypothetical protein